MGGPYEQPTSPITEHDAGSDDADSPVGDGDDWAPPGDGDGDGDGDDRLPDDCGSSSVVAQPITTPVDIVWVIDASGSMIDEQKRVRDNLTKFANDISASALDARIVMLTKSASKQLGCNFPDDPMQDTPLASDPRYHYVQASVSSTNALQVAVNRYDDYKDLLRPDSVVNFVFLTDDESSYGSGLLGADARAQRFRDDMTALLGRPFKAHTISSPGPSACSSLLCDVDLNLLLCGPQAFFCSASRVGATYYSLANTTGGLTANICEVDWTKIFTPLTDAIIRSAPLPCEYPIPAPPPGQSFDRERVNVSYSAAEGQTTLVPSAGDASACGDQVAWHYNEDVTKVMLCPAACERVSGGGALDIAFGCKTITLY